MNKEIFYKTKSYTSHLFIINCSLILLQVKRTVTRNVRRTVRVRGA